MQSDPYTENLLDDLVRTAMVGSGLILVLVVLRVAFLRWKSPVGDRLRDSSPAALLSYGLFALIPTVQGFQSLGKPLGPLWPLYLVALLAGVYATFAQVRFSLFGNRGRREAKPRPGSHRHHE